MNRKQDFLLHSELAKKIYRETAEKLPICDYHCHLSPKEIFEDKPFDGIGQVWLGGDHYKWRFMRGAGIDEEFITGSASFDEKFLAYAKALDKGVGNPLVTWSDMELSYCFGIDKNLSAKNAPEILEKANAYIRENRISPRKMIEKFGVRFIATTDDPCDDLHYHELIAADKSFKTVVSPSFRTDRLLDLTKPDFKDYAKKLSDASGVEIKDVDSLLEVIEKRIVYFKAHGCAFSDVGMQAFPDRVGSKKEADFALRSALAGIKITHDAFMAFLGYFFVELGVLYEKYGLCMQLHTGAYRNPNTGLFEKIGADCGCDCIGASVSASALIRILDAIECRGKLPKTVLYTLDPSATEMLVSVAGSFRNVVMGAAWWFNDHDPGIRRVIGAIASEGCLGSFLGMLTDSRSFLSYTRHDYFRRILCDELAKFAEEAAVSDPETLKTVTADICFGNAAAIAFGT